MEMMAGEVRITIKLFPNGQLQVIGPMDNLVLVFGLLELAKVNFITNIQKPSSPIVISNIPS